MRTIGGPPYRVTAMITVVTMNAVVTILALRTTKTSLMAMKTIFMPMNTTDTISTYLTDNNTMRPMKLVVLMVDSGTQDKPPRAAPRTTKSVSAERIRACC